MTAPPLDLKTIVTDGDVRPRRANDWGVDPENCNGLFYAYRGGAMLIGATVSLVLPGQVELTPNATNYVQRDDVGGVFVRTDQFTAVPLARVTTDEIGITDYEDWRPVVGFARPFDAAAVVLPGAGRTVPNLTAYLANNAVFNVLDYGASPVGTAAANAAAIQAAATAAGTTGLLYFPTGTVLPTNGNLVIHGPVLGSGATLLWSGAAGDAIAVGAFFDGTGTPEYIQDVPIDLPHVVNVNKGITLGWAMAGVVGTVGVRFRHVYDCKITIPNVSNFETGALFYGEHDGCDYNDIWIGFLRNNKRNLMADATVDGWCNENNVQMGRLAHDPAEGAYVAGVRQILIAGGTSATSALNNWRIRVSMEVSVPEYTVETKGGDTVFDWCRWEQDAGHPPKFLSNGIYTLGNEVRNGYDSHRIAFTAINAGQHPRVFTRDSLAISGASDINAVLRLVNNDSSASPVIRIYKAGADLMGVAAQTSWQWQFTANGLQGKADTDAAAVKRLFLDPATGDATFARVLSSLLYSGGGQAAVANGATALLVPGFSWGLVLIGDTNTGNSCLMWIGFGSDIIKGDSTHFSLAAGNPGHYNVYVDGAGLHVQNLRGADAAIPFVAVQLF